jgi:hypothetical protein
VEARPIHRLEWQWSNCLSLFDLHAAGPPFGEQAVGSRTGEAARDTLPWDCAHGPAFARWDLEIFITLLADSDLTWVSWTKLCERMSLSKELRNAEEEV